MSARDVNYMLIFGNYKGWRICDVPDSYLNWILDTEFEWMDDQEQEDMKSSIEYYFESVKRGG